MMQPILTQEQVTFLKDVWAQQLRDSTAYLKGHPDNPKALRDNFKALHALEIMGVKF